MESQEEHRLQQALIHYSQVGPSVDIKEAGLMLSCTGDWIRWYWYCGLVWNGQCCERSRTIPDGPSLFWTGSANSTPTLAVCDAIVSSVVCASGMKGYSNLIIKEMLANSTGWTRMFACCWISIADRSRKPLGPWNCNEIGPNITGSHSTESETRFPCAVGRIKKKKV